jgi:hypothetical protein
VFGNRNRSRFRVHSDLMFTVAHPNDSATPITRGVAVCGRNGGDTALYIATKWLNRVAQGFSPGCGKKRISPSKWRPNDYFWSTFVPSLCIAFKSCLAERNGWNPNRISDALSGRI